MSLIKIPDGDRTPLYIESLEIVGVRDAGNDETWLFIKGEEDGWKVKCNIDGVISLIPKRK